MCIVKEVNAEVNNTEKECGTGSQYSKDGINEGKDERML